MTTTAPRRSMRSVVTIGQDWLRRSRSKDRTVVRVTQVHRADRLVEVVGDEGNRFQLSFADLRDHWRLVGGCE